jgi:required for meiotic nuclear division protein 1
MTLTGTTFNARALLLGTRLDLRGWPEAETLARMPLAVRVAGGGVAVLFRYGAAVLFDVPPEAERALRQRLGPLVENRYTSADEEALALRVEPGRAEGLADGALMLQSGGVAQLQLVADVLSKSALLAHYETRLGVEFDRIEPFALQLESHGRIRWRTREHLQRIGALLRMEQRMVGRAEIGDKPELLWEHPELERLYALLEAEFEVHERLAVMERKLDLAGRTVRTLVDLINARHSLRVEWYIVALILVEILLTLYGMWFR